MTRTEKLGLLLLLTGLLAGLTGTLGPVMPFPLQAAGCVLFLLGDRPRQEEADYEVDG